MARPQQVTEELAQLRNTRQMLFYLAQTIDQRDHQIAEALNRLDIKLDQLACLLEQYNTRSEREALEAGVAPVTAHAEWYDGILGSIIV